MFKVNFQQLLLLDFFIWLICLHAALACHGDLLTAGITEQEKQIILHEHNRLRQQVATGRYPGQPAAKNMKEMLWDKDLAERAQKWAENCQFKHDPHRSINRFTMGQNLAIIWSTAPLDQNDGDFPSRIENWFNEVQKYSFGDAWTPKTGHYSQLVWGDTNLIGCGFAEYKDSNKYNKLYVCNYGPGGNVYGYNPYEAGKPSCSAYGMKSSPRYQGLCMAADSDYNDNAIETYEYKTTNLFNAPLTTNTQTTPYIINTHTYYRPNTNVYNNYAKKSLYPSSSSFNQQATSYTASSVYLSASSPDPAATLSGSSAAAIQQTAKAASSKKGGNRESAQSFYGTNNSQYYKHGHQFEAHRPVSAAELPKSVFVQTAAHISAATLEQQQKQQHQQHQQHYHLWSPTTIRPRPSGWNLYSWLG